MFRHHFTFALRALAAHKLYTAINLIGLTICLACVMTVAMYVRHEFSFDRHFTKADRIYRMGTIARATDGSDLVLAGSYVPLGPAMETDFPEVIESARVYVTNGTFRIGDKFLRESYSWVDPEIFDLIRGQGPCGRSLNGPDRTEHIRAHGPCRC